MSKTKDCSTRPAVGFGEIKQVNANEYDFEDSNSFDFDDDREVEDPDSDEDTEDASETDMIKREEEYTELKEQMYRDKQATLKKQLQQLKDGQHQDYNKRFKKIEQNYKDRLFFNSVMQNVEIDRIEREYINEKRSSAREFEDKKIDLRETLIIDLEEKRRTIEMERTTMELTGDSMEVKPVTTRKLRRRPNDPLPLPEKRRKTSPTLLNILLDENEILDDLKAISKGKSFLKKPSELLSDGPPYDVKLEDGKLYFDKKWFQRGQPVLVESKESSKFSGVITAMGSNEIYIRKTFDHSKIRIYISQLQKGKFILKKKS